MGLEELKNACSILGIDYQEFIAVPEVEKGITDYKSAYEQQKALNEQILANIGEISKSFDSKFQTFSTDFSKQMVDKMNELTKSFDTLRGEVDGMKSSPMRNAKSATKVTVIEKSVGNQNNGVKTYNLQNFVDVKELKKYLGDRALEDLQKGINGGLYEKAAMQLDASRTIAPDLVKRLLDQDKIQIQ